MWKGLRLASGRRWLREVSGMKLAIMQPYLFPYLGYFQLIRAVASYVVYAYVKGQNQLKPVFCKKGGACLALLP